MASNTIKTMCIRNRKRRKNKANSKADEKRMRSNLAVLEKCSTK
jgi:hypothetical protein